GFLSGSLFLRRLFLNRLFHGHLFLSRLFLGRLFLRCLFLGRLFLSCLFFGRLFLNHLLCLHRRREDFRFFDHFLFLGNFCLFLIGGRLCRSFFQEDQEGHI